MVSDLLVSHGQPYLKITLDALDVPEWLINIERCTNCLACHVWIFCRSTLECARERDAVSNKRRVAFRMSLHILFPGISIDFVFTVYTYQATASGRCRFLFSRSGQGDLNMNWGPKFTYKIRNTHSFLENCAWHMYPVHFHGHIPWIQSWSFLSSSSIQRIQVPQTHLIGCIEVG